jgi:hypothetical protein
MSCSSQGTKKPVLKSKSVQNHIETTGSYNYTSDVMFDSHTHNHSDKIHSPDFRSSYFLSYSQVIRYTHRTAKERIFIAESSISDMVLDKSRKEKQI